MMNEKYSKNKIQISIINIFKSKYCIQYQKTEDYTSKVSKWKK